MNNSPVPTSNKQQFELPIGSKNIHKAQSVLRKRNVQDRIDQDEINSAAGSTKRMRCTKSGPMAEEKHVFMPIIPKDKSKINHS